MPNEDERHHRAHTVRPCPDAAHAFQFCRCRLAHLRHTLGTFCPAFPR
ncbi:hypothetical protein [Pseudonocardia thermophila]|nr:hypothetical protein [Pseudonocardia thermophila]